MSHARPKFAVVCPAFKAGAWRSLGQMGRSMHYIHKRP